MRQFWWSFCCVLIMLSAIGCRKDIAQEQKEELTIFVEADRTQLVEKEKELRNKEAQFTKEREQLRKEKEKLMVSKEQIEDKDYEQTNRMNELERNLWKKEREMWEREEEIAKEREKLASQKDKWLNKLVPEGEKQNEGDGRHMTLLAREESLGRRESALANREKELANREAQLASREADFIRLKTKFTSQESYSVPQPQKKGQVPHPKKLEKIYNEVREGMRKRGILSEDLTPETARLEKDIERARNEGDFFKLQDLLHQYKEDISAIRVDANFIDGKFARLSQLINKASLSKTDKEKVAKRQRRAIQSYSDGKFILANKELTAIWLLLSN